MADMALPSYHAEMHAFFQPGSIAIMRVSKPPPKTAKMAPPPKPPGKKGKPAKPRNVNGKEVTSQDRD